MLINKHDLQPHGYINFSYLFLGLVSVLQQAVLIICPVKWNENMLQKINEESGGGGDASLGNLVLKQDFLCNGRIPALLGINQ